jgi:hypothetical protein
MISRPRALAWMVVPLTLALLMVLGPNPYGATPRSVAQEDFWDSYQWRVSYEQWRREHPGAARMLDAFELELREKRTLHLPDDCSSDCH